jgi:predicted ATPase
VLAARIDRLAPEDKRLLQAAAVVGKDVPYLLLQGVAELSESTLREGLARLQAAEFLYETSLFPDLEYTFKHALTHEVAYGGLLQERRRTLHARIVDAIETLYADRLIEQAERLAHHACRGELWPQAVSYLCQAGDKAAARSAYREAIAYYEQALGALPHLPAGPETTRQAIAIRLGLGLALLPFRERAEEADAIYSTARDLCLETGDTAQLFRALWGLWLLSGAVRRHHRAKALGQELFVLAEQRRDRALQLEAHHALCATAFTRAELRSGVLHAEQGVALYDSRLHRGHAAIYSGHDPGACCRNHLAAMLWLLGYPEQALRSSQDALTLAEELSHPLTLVMSLIWIARIHYYCGEREAVQERIEAAIALATDQRLDRFAVFASILRGRVLVEQGQASNGLAQIQRVLASMDLGGPLDAATGRALLAEVCQQLGRIEEGLDAIAEALADSQQTGRVYYDAELLRLRGELRLSQSPPAEADAEQSFHEALAVSRQQQAKSLELRTATSLARLWQRQGKPAEARQLLADVYGWFTEGFDTRDLQEARLLLAELY